MTNFLILLLCAAIVGGASLYIWRQKKKGVKCIGCPDSKTCSGSCHSCQCGCKK